MDLWQINYLGQCSSQCSIIWIYLEYQDIHETRIIIAMNK